jgi:acyl transferase domain-containing protein/phosphopantetheinyl transferase (holo-ACP synthase)
MRRRSNDVAIVGMACRFPGARDLFAYFENLLAGRSAIRDVPKSRWDADEFFDPDCPDNDRVGSRRGGYLDEPITFDAAAHRIMPRTVEGGEPEQFLILELARAALADAGLDQGAPDGWKVEVVIGRGNYFNRGNLARLQHGRIVAQTLAMLRAIHPDWSETDFEAIRRDLKSSLPPFEAATIPGQLTNATAGRLASRFNFHGASYVIDAASASALAALDLGSRAIIERRAELAIVGGVYLEADVDFPLVFSRLAVLSGSGESHPFGANADGMVAGEGAGVVVLKSLADAERDGDRVYAVVKGVGLASDGGGSQLTAPSARGHLRAIRNAYRRARVDPASVELIEGHGLGVPAADRAELRALLAAFPPTTTRMRRTLGAASGLIGHAMPAAGMAGLIKAALALFHRVVPPSQSADHPHPLLRACGDRLTLNRATRPWIHSATTPRRAGVNAFGFAGINAHAVLEEHSASADGSHASALRDWPDEAILLAAPDRASLAGHARQFRDQLRRRAEVPLRDVAFTLNQVASSNRSTVRLGLVVRSVAELIERLDAAAQKVDDPGCHSIRDGRGVYFWEQPLGETGGLAFLFPGEGSQYRGMLADLCPHFPIIRAHFDSSDRLALESGAASPPSEHLFGAQGKDSSLWESATAVNIVLSSQLAIYQLLLKLGLRPAAVVGHSSGEFLALAAAGVVRVDRGLEIRFNELAELFARLETSGAIPSARLVGVATSRDRVESAIANAAGDIVVAIDNCPHQVVVAGAEAEVERVIQRLRGEGVTCEDLPFARAYHTPAFEAVLDPVRRFFETLEIASPTVDLYSCCVATRTSRDPEEIRRLAVAQWTRPVEFRRTIDAMHVDGIRLFVDVGARGNLAGFTEDTLRGKPAFAIAANLPKRSGLTQLNHLVASLFAQGVSLSVEPLYERRRVRRVDFDAVPEASPATVTLQIGFPEMRLSPSMIEALRAKQSVAVSPPIGEMDDSEDSTSDRPAELEPSEESAVLGYMGSMSAFLRTQRQVMNTYLGPRCEAETPSYALATVDAGSTPVSSAFAATPNTHDVPWSQPGARQFERNDHFWGADEGANIGDHGPWAGELVSYAEGREVVARITLDAAGDPVAENHTFGGRRVSRVDPHLLGLPVLPFTVMAEMLIDVASRLAPGATLVGLRDVRARRWVRYEDEPIELELRASVERDRPGEIRSSLFNRASILGSEADETPAVEGTVVFADRRDPAPPAAPFDLGETEPCRFTALSMYDEQWLFHGPALRAVVGVGPISDLGIEGALRVPSRFGLLRPGENAAPKSAPVVLDAFTHLLGCWGLDRLPAGDVIFPLRLGSLEIFGDDPPEGTDVACRISVTRLERHSVRVQSEIIRPDGRVWMRLNDWDDWRFYWPPRYRDMLRRPERELLGEPLTLDGETGAIAVWLEPPGDFGRPVWRDVLEQVQLSPQERQGRLKPTGDEPLRTLGLWGRVAAKEAARRLWLAEGQAPMFPADLAIEPDANGRPALRSRLEPDRDDMPAISIAHADGVAVGIATRDPSARVGIDVISLDSSRDASGPKMLTNHEQSLLDHIDAGDQDEWRARFWSAKQAVARSMGQGPSRAAEASEVLECDRPSGVLTVSVASAATPIDDRPSQPSARVLTERRGGYVWAWTITKDVMT